MNPLALALLTVSLFGLRHFFFHFVFFPIGRTKVAKDENQLKTLKKLSESGYKIVYYLPLWIWGVYIANQEGLLTNTRKYWEGIPNPPISENLLTFYTFQLAFYFYTTLSLVCFDVKRKDYYALLIHHFVTICLIYFSWFFGYVRVGTIVFICMDIVDVFLEAAKFTNYLKLNPLFPNVFFTLMVLSWAGFRLFLFPYLVVRSAFSESTDVHLAEGHDYKMSVWYLFNSLLWILQALQVYWFYYVIKALVRMLTTGKVEDVTDKQLEKARDHKIHQEKNDKTD
jgi:ceramide synthetase